MGAGLSQQPTPSSKLASAHPSSSAPADAWKSSMRDEVLCGKPLRQSSPETSAAVPRENLYSIVEEEDIDIDYADEESVQACKGSGSGSGTTHPQHRYPVMMPGAGLARVAVPPIPVMSAIAAPASPVSACSSTATDTPRSILRQSGTGGGRTPRSNSRRISFVGVSSPRPDEHRCCRDGDEESGDDSDDYESAEPSLRYDIVTLAMSATSTPPRHSRKVHSHDPSLHNGHYHSHEHGEDDSNGALSPVPASQHQQKRTSPSLSPERPRLSSRSPTHSPPRDSGSGYTISAGAPLSAAVTAPSAPPPPEEETDVITLDAAPQHRALDEQDLLKSPKRGGNQRRAKSPSMGTNGRDEDVLTQPHNRSEPSGSSHGAVVVRRLPPRQRWPSEAYQDEPQTEVSKTQRARRSRRERLDPEADMGSSSSRCSSDMGSSCTGSDDSLSARYASPLKLHQEGYRGSSYQSTSSSPPALACAAAVGSAGAPPIGHPSPHRRSTSARKDRDGTSSERSREKSLTPRSPPSLTQRDDTDEPIRGSSDHDHHHRHSSRGAETRSGLPAEAGAALPTSHNRGRGTRVGVETRGPYTHAVAAAFHLCREASYSPSTITDRSSGQSVAGDLSGSVSEAAAQEARRAPRNYQQQHEVVPSALSATTAAAPLRLSKDRKVKKAVVAEEPQVYVDPLLLERRHRHELTRQESPSHVERHSGLHARRRRPGSRTAAQQQPTTFQSVSLRDIMMRHDSPETKSRRGTPSSQSTAPAILRLPSDVRQLQLQHNGDGDDDDAAHTLTPGAVALEASVASSSLLSSGGVPADELFWDEPTPTSRASSRSPPPVSPRSSSTLAPNTPDRHKVLRKKLVVVVRRKKNGSAQSENDPVVQMSLLPFKEETAALLKANASLQGSPQQRRAHSSGTSAAATVPTLEKLINKVERGESASVFSRCLSRASEHQGQRPRELSERRDGGDDHAGENEISEENRRRFRHALSVLSSRSVSPRASVSPSTTSKAGRSQRSRTRSPDSQINASYACARPLRCSGSASEESVSHTGDAALRRSSGRRHISHVAAVSETAAASIGATSPPQRRSARGGSRHSDEKSARRSEGGHRHKSRRRHSHESIAHSTAGHQRRSLSGASMPGAPYCAAQNDEFYGAADMAKDVATLFPSPFQERIGITPMSMPLLPRLVLRAELGALPQGQYAHHPHSNIDAAQRTNGSWSASDDEDEHAMGRITDSESGGRRSRPLMLQFSSGTQTDRATGVNHAFGSARSGMPLLAATPVQRAAAIGPIGGTLSSAHPGKPVGTSVPTIGAGLAASLLAPTHNAAGDAVFNEEMALAVEKRAANSPLVAEASATESPASFVKRAASPAAAAKPFTDSNSRILSGSGSGAAKGRGEAAVFGGNVGASRAAYAPLFSATSAHVAASSSRPAAQDLSTAARAMMDATTSVPLFFPPLTVDNVSQLSHDWQSTLRERSSKAKRSVMESFLIASAEAGAATTAAAVAAAAPSPPLYLADPAATDVNPSDMCAGGCGGLTVPAVGAEAPSEWQQRARPAQAHQGLAVEEFYGRSVTSAAIANAPRSAHSLPPRSGPQSFSEIKCDVWQRSGSPQLAAQREPEQQQATRSPPFSAPSENKSVQGKSAMPVGSVSKSCAASKSRDGVEERSTSARKHSRRRRRRASPERRANSNGDQLTDALNAETLSTVAADSPCKSSSSAEKINMVGDVTALAGVSPQPLSRESLPVPATLGEAKQKAQQGDQTSDSSSRPCSAVGNGTAANAAVATATDGVGARSAPPPPPPFFSIVEAAAESRASRSVEKAAEKGRGNHQRDERREHLSRHSPSPFSSEASQSPSSKRRKTSSKHKTKHDGDDKHKKRKHGHGRHGRYSRSGTRSLSGQTCDTAAAEIDSDSDVDSNLTTSIEFQLSRLLLLREAAVFTKPPLSAAVDASRRNTRKKDKADGKAARKAAAAKDEHHRHRNRSSKEKRKRSSKRAAKQRSKSPAATTESRLSDGADRKKKKREKAYHCSTSPSKPGPLPPPPPHQRSRALYGEEAAASAAASLSDVASRYRLGAPGCSPRDDGAAFASTRPYFRVGRIYRGGQGEDAEAPYAHHRAAAHTGADSETPYERYRRPSHTSPLRGQRSYVAPTASGWADGFRPACRPAPRPAATAEDPSLWHRSYSSASRPSTRWNDYVRDAERGAAGRSSSSPYMRAHHSRSLGQRRRGSDAGIPTAGECGRGSSAEGGSPSSEQPGSGTYSATYASRRRQTDEFDDINVAPIRQYFNDHGQVGADERGGGVQYGTTSAFERHPSRSAASNRAPTARPWLSNNYERSRAVATQKHANVDDLLVSTPPNDGDEGCVPDNANDLSHARQRQRRSTLVPPLPPPPSPPQASTTPSAAPTDTVFAAIPRSGALPILSEHTVTDAQTAEDFVQGVRGIISSLQQYRNSV
ncbi:conserved hypothetical protein [Leishmania major strain Friedlin]|uniref:Uncharacterized protein n=1 Tax=Leishmania major TaxID=5664 RepID=Q4Q392_LEIMA|nr:conserved hypothetical protein [Leishmania major strain Friedlin]CAG9581937.1 hypothetical_protein_-_conserved [Leishmania major strain Friedlin]CAJ07820.1 conserved hypothetical protein [Leishmania major strain Friedlin]|eukprot:XP_001686206.1 conserved hypothetical protein [Leishmania major strain Friedlin]